MYLTVVPPDVLRQHLPGRPQPRGGGVRPPLLRLTNGEPEDTAASDEGKQRVERPNQNANLKSAWAATQHARIYGPQSPFFDSTARSNKKIIPSDRAGVRICLPMALRGGCYDNCSGKHDTLSDAEVQRVAEAGNLTIT
jgi:hypothetical protein